MPKTYKIAVVGATGAVGEELLQILERRKFPFSEVRCFASEKSAGKKTACGKMIASIKEDSFKGIDIAFFCAGSKISRTFAPLAKQSGAIVIDNSSAFRMEPHVPLVIPEINPHALKNHQGMIASPNCCVAIMLMALFPLHRKVQIKRIVATTYQAASGAGKKAMEELVLETKAHLEKKTFERTVFAAPYAFNLFLHNSPVNHQGYAEEEIKMVQETRKILEDDSIQVAATCVRVPILRAHSEALNVEFKNPIDKKQALSLLKKAPGVTVLEEWNENRFPMPVDAALQDNIFCGRIREDLSQPNTLDLWVVGDQLLKGAALNCVQIAEKL